MTLMRMPMLLSAMAMFGVFASPAFSSEAGGAVVRIARLVIDPAQLTAYQIAVKEEMAESVRLEPGVLAIYSVAEKGHPNRLHFFEIYADDAAYRSHIASPHFQKYLTTTKAMIVSKELLETEPVQLSAKAK